MGEGVRVRPPALRPYQLEPVRAVLDSVRRQAGLTFVVEMGRQGGKNETSSRIEAALLTANRHAGGGIVKTAPTEKPQLVTSYDRLSAFLAADGIPHRKRYPDLFVGRASFHVRSGSKDANVAGATASLLLEVDEAQDMDEGTYQRRFRPMAATTNATTVMYGTAWSDVDLLAATIAANEKLEKADGIRRNFIVPGDVIGGYVPAYAAYLAAERARLGADHPLIRTEYDLVPLSGEGKLFNPQQLRMLRGAHPRLNGPVLTERYVGGLDLGGEDTGGGSLNDRTVLTIGRVGPKSPAGNVPCEIVEHHAWRGARHADLIPALVSVAKRWRLFALTVDATGVGEVTAALLASQLGQTTVDAFKFTQQSKSELGFETIASVNTGALCLYADDGSDDYATATRELAAAQKESRPNATINFYVPDALGNDDYLMSLCLANRAAQQHPPRIARMRR